MSETGGSGAVGEVEVRTKFKRDGMKSKWLDEWIGMVNTEKKKMPPTNIESQQLGLNRNQAYVYVYYHAEVCALTRACVYVCVCIRGSRRTKSPSDLTFYMYIILILSSLIDYARLAFDGAGCQQRAKRCEMQILT